LTLATAAQRVRPTKLSVDVEPVDPARLDMLAPQWRALERAAVSGPFLSFDWLAAWAAVYEPRGLRLVRISEAAGDLVALGLIETVFPGRRWRFAGWPVTSVRGLLCPPEQAAAAWDAFGDWLAANSSDWWTLEAEGLESPPGFVGGRRGAEERVAWYAVDLPGTFDAYLGRLPGERRRKLRKSLRVAERAGVREVAVEPDGYGPALDAFVALHRERALSKGEARPGIDDRLARMLTEVGRRDPSKLATVVLEKDGRVVAVQVLVVAGGVAHGYNLGWDPDLAQLRLGKVVTLLAVRGSIDAGERRLDLGPGDSATKRELGGARRVCYSVRLWSASPQGRTLHLAAAGRARAQKLQWLRAAVQAARLRIASRRLRVRPQFSRGVGQRSTSRDPRH
jgi:CelD/BcsL family acetyltransferase involved in cellulose biosynthesis